jgi:hypothetical protein
VPINQEEAEHIAARITPIFDRVSADYDFAKYPGADYLRFKTSFSSLNRINNDISDSLRWKWGHWDKPNFPQRHKNLIAHIKLLWPQFVASGSGATSSRTYQWWSSALARKTAYITVAYITHLVHYREPLPIIDQHNFRAMNSLLRDARPTHRGKKKPSQWADIVELKDFMEAVRARLTNRGFEELDRFLMMYGSNHAAR